MSKEILERLRKDRKTYGEMIDFCCDSMILNNNIIQNLTEKGIYFDVYAGDEKEYFDADGNEITKEEFEKLEEQGEDVRDEYVDIFQYFIIGERDAERLAEYTNSIIFYNDNLDLYLLGVAHFGTSWDYVRADWKELEDYEE